MNKQGQVAIYIIIAIVIVGGIVLLFAFQNGFIGDSIPEEFQPVYSYYDSCVRESADFASKLSQTRGGFVNTQDFEQGSEFSPFGNQLNFFGTGVPYWFYQTGNGLIKEQVPKIKDIEKNIADYIYEDLRNCDLSNFELEGFVIQRGEPIIDVEVNDEEIIVNVKENLVVSKGEESARRANSEINVQSKLGKFYDIAVKIYDKQREESFLENYSVDVLRLNAPVDGVETQCDAEVWKTPEVFNDIRNSLAANIGAIKMKGNYYSLSEENRKYFVVDEAVDEEVNFVYLPEVFPSKIEVSPANDNLMIAEPLGNDLGLGAFGFCYVPYHFVYDVSYPVLVQIRSGSEIFQFPIVVIIDNNVPRQAELQELNFEQEEDAVDICEFANKEIDVSTFDSNLNPVEADVEYRCFDQVCNVGRTIISGGEANLIAKVPSCVNGELSARAEGFADKKQVYSSNVETIADLIMDKEYEVSVDLVHGGIPNFDGTAIIYFDNGEDIKTFVYPSTEKISLTQGNYNVTAYVYGDSSIVFPASSRTECTSVPKANLFGLFNSNEEKCFNIDIPETRLDSALVGGGKTNLFIFDSDLEMGEVTISSSVLPSPRSVEDLQTNYELFKGQQLEVNFG